MAWLCGSKVAVCELRPRRECVKKKYHQSCDKREDGYGEEFDKGMNEGLN